MASKNQIKANRQNAQNSTGPKTEEGKKTVSQNAVRHGLNAVNIIINSPKLKEDQAEYDLLVAALKMELEPQDTLQLHMVYKIANTHWRYRRLINAETAEINKQATPPEPYLKAQTGLLKVLQDRDIKDQDQDWFACRSIPRGDAAAIFGRYEWRLNRELHHAYKMLRELQAYENRQIKKSQNKPNSPQPHQQKEHTERFFPSSRPESSQFNGSSRNSTVFESVGQEARPPDYSKLSGPRGS